NFADIIALPLLLGVGVAFKIYYIMAWRAGKTALLQSALTRAVVYSAMTTATAFGSLWLSAHPGTSSMGKLMALALVCTLPAAVWFQPALMGPREKAHSFRQAGVDILATCRLLTVRCSSSPTFSSRRNRSGRSERDIPGRPRSSSLKWATSAAPEWNGVDRARGRAIVEVVKERPRPATRRSSP